MIASLRGLVVSLTAHNAVIECAGVGMAVILSPTARDQLRQGEEGNLLTHLVVREDSLTLYGFANSAEREVFTTAQSVSGVGPRLALALISTLGADGLVKAVATEDVAALSKVPGIGRKSAQKLILSLSGKLSGFVSHPGSAGSGSGLPGSVSDEMGSQVQAALEGLGWPAAQAADAVAQVQSAPDAPADVAGLLRASLARLGGRR
ncbi:MAG: Holliday junction branch migration protein RuvA [Bifidobacteriaceae bacterium]|nr:Holliday junction branch migration protein RuvA [Bifidobacteriaceae bacterium]